MNCDTERSVPQGWERSKRRRTGTKEVSKLWTDFYQSCLRLDPECQPAMIEYDQELKQYWCRVQCPYGKFCGYHGAPHIYKRMLLVKPREQDRRKLLEHVRNKHPEIALRFDVAVMEEEEHTGHQKSPEDPPRIQLDGQVSTPLLCSDEDPAVVSSEDAEKALQSSDECSVCTEDLEDSDASDDEEADPDEIDTPTNERFRCTQGSHFKSFLMAVLGEEEGNDFGQAGEDMGEEDEAPCTLLQLTSALLELEIKHAISKEAMQDILSIVRMGRRNYDRMIIPPSIHLLRKTMGVPDLQTVEYHKCPCGYIYKNTVLPNERNKDEECGAGCGNSVYKSAWFRWLTEKEPNAGDKVTSIWSIGIDGSQPFGRRAHSCTLIVLKCEDMDSEGRYLSCNSRLLGIIPGPKEPKDLNPFLCFIGEEFERLRSSTMSYEYQECDESGEAIKYSGTHRPVLGFIYADAKAREKVHLCFPGNAIKGCYFCWQHASQVLEHEEGTSRKRRLFTGYVENDAATHVNGLNEHVFEASRDDRPAIQKSVIEHAHMEQILNTMKNATLHGTHKGTTLKEWQKRLGIYDYAKVFHVVPTLHVKHGIPAPLYHLVLLGLAKNFIKYIWDGHGNKKTSDPDSRSMRVTSKETIKRLEKGIILSNSFNRPYSSIEYCNGWICEEVKFL
eukprot:jgi/Picre1/29263/NNA_004655.t1